VKRLFCCVTVLLFIVVLSGCRDERPPNLVFSIEDVNGRIIGAIYGTPSVRIADELGAARPLRTGDELMGNLLIGSVDCVIMERSAAEEVLTRTQGVRMLPEPLLEYDMRFAVAKENAELLQAVNNALVALNENGTLGGFRDKYFSGIDFVYVPPEDVELHPGSLTLALPPDSPPYSSMDAEGRFSGMDVDVARAVCDYLGVELQIIENDARELVTAVWFGRADLALGWLPSEGEELINISEAYSHAVHVVLVRK